MSEVRAGDAGPAARLAAAAAPGAPPPGMAAMRDGFGRAIDYLRISVTDKCNMRCIYCMPMQGTEWLRHDELLTYEEIAEVVRVLAGMGLRRVRLTGGEPLVRRDLADLVRLLAAIPQLEDIALSTNGVLLEATAGKLREAGLHRVNVSLDSLRPARVDELARRPGSFQRIMAGIAAAERAGFAPLKVNCVVMRGHNDDELADFAAVTRERPWHVRFIEVMPVAGSLDLSARAFVPAAEMLERLRGVGELEPTSGPAGNGPATYFRLADAAGTVGVIAPMSHNFCDRCNRVRLTADGRLRPCLFGDLHTDLREVLRAGRPLEPLVRRTLALKPERHNLVRGRASGSGGLISLSQVGG